MRALRDDRDRFRERAKEVCSGAGVGVNEATSSKEQEGGGGGGGDAPSSSGLANEIMSSGRISGTPPTRVETT